MTARVALLGFGTVGSEIARRLSAGSTVPGLSLTHIFDRRAGEKRRAHPSSSAQWTSRIEDVLHSNVDIVIETLGGVEPASLWIREALLAGKSVVTANKQVIAHHGAALWTLAARQGRQLRFEAAVGGAMPIVRAVGEGLSGDRIVRIEGILNGTTNAVLSLMEAGASLEDAVADARARGYAEADPSADLDGTDARAKLAILCALAFGVRVEPRQIDVRSCAAIGASDLARARAQHGAIRQVAHAEYDDDRRALVAWVAPVVVPAGSFFARITGAQNGALITGEHSGDIGIFGAGAGGAPTAVAVISDAVAIARDRSAVVPAPLLTSNFVVRPSSLSNHSLAEAV